MANVDNPHGFAPLLVLSGGPIQTEEFSKVVGYGTAIFRQDLVNRVADGSIEASITPGTTLISGVALDYGAALTATVHKVVVGADTVFEAQADGSLVEADMGMNANAILGAGSATTKLSGHEINSATEAVTGTLDLHLLKKLAVPDNAYGNYVRLEVLINKHRMHGSAVGV